MTPARVYVVATRPYPEKCTGTSVAPGMCAAMFFLDQRDAQEHCARLNSALTSKLPKSAKGGPFKVYAATLQIEPDVVEALAEIDP